MLRFAVTALGIAALGSVGGCPIFMNEQDTAELRVVHASPDAPAVDICVNGVRAFSNAAFATGTDYATVTSGNQSIRVIVAGGECSDEAVIAADVDVAADADVTVAAIGELANIRPLVLTDDNTAPAAGEARVRFVHLASDAPAVDIALPDETILFDDVSFEQSGGYVSVPADTYTLLVQTADNTTTVLTLDSVTVEDGGVYSVFAVGLLAGNPELNALITVDRAPNITN